MAKGTEVRVELLLGRRVRDRQGRPVGRIEEVRAEEQGKEVRVTEYLVGSSAMLERLSVQAFLLTFPRLLGWGKKSGGYRVPWDQLDLADPDRPRLLCDVGELERLGER